MIVAPVCFVLAITNAQKYTIIWTASLCHRQCLLKAPLPPRLDKYAHTTLPAHWSNIWSTWLEQRISRWWRLQRTGWRWWRRLVMRPVFKRELALQHLAANPSHTNKTRNVCCWNQLRRCHYSVKHRKQTHTISVNCRKLSKSVNKTVPIVS